MALFSIQNRKAIRIRKRPSENEKELHSLIASNLEEILGVILIESEYPIPNGRIDTLGVDPEYQKKGLGRFLMEEMINYMKKVGCTTIYTLVNWRDWSMLQFFDAMGFKRGDMVNLEYKME